ncbi:hypothetical protein AUC31_17455 [Planococcus rifietoensis]|uniref:Uncharacterized protein n=1 Tax=Planococcus rifietoensis TaxID=200991 RepID=A0A0U2XIW5_9BACL|nr:hypothetical protein [Planococcus rifietoensis]ALS76895.1 hypothetical protein AUC31_17455 [Planococcus rifietoensis]
MNSDYIQLAIAVVAVVAAVIATVNTTLIKKQINLQKDQWEFSQIPIFKISYTKGISNSASWLVIENSNSVFHQIDQIIISSDDLVIEKYWNNFVHVVIEGEPREFHGLLIMIRPVNKLFCEAVLQIRGKDSLGNEFVANTIPLKFNQGILKNGIELTNTYLRKL